MQLAHQIHICESTEMSQIISIKYATFHDLKKKVRDQRRAQTEKLHQNKIERVDTKNNILNQRLCNFISIMKYSFFKIDLNIKTNIMTSRIKK